MSWDLMPAGCPNIHIGERFGLGRGDGALGLDITDALGIASWVEPLSDKPIAAQIGLVVAAVAGGLTIAFG